MELSELKIPSRTFSDVGRVLIPGGAAKRLPPKLPPTILSMADRLH